MIHVARKAAKTSAAWLQKQIDKKLFPWVLALAGFLDVWLIVIPTDGIIIAATLAHPKNWKRYALALSLGSTIGGLSLAFVFANYGIMAIESQFPGFVGSSFWLATEFWVGRLGLWALFLVAASPLSQQPAIILTAMTHHTLTSIFLTVLAGRGAKYFFLCYMIKWAPNKVMNLWGVRQELEEIDDPHVHLPPQN